MIKSYKDLLIWQKSIDLVKEIYEVTSLFPKSEIFGITSQIQRAAVSIPSNIAGGSARSGSRELSQFLRISLGSLAELDTQITIAYQLKYLSNKHKDLISCKIEELQKKTNSLISKIKNKSLATNHSPLTTTK